ncbi:MAG: hypothetical protein OHK0013_19450 [Sandaracinaceae bacterium]
MLVAAALAGAWAVLPSWAVAWPSSTRPPPTMRRIRHPSREWTFPEIRAGERRFRTMAYDGHVHSAFSRDAIHPIGELMWLAERVDLDMVVVTDHGSSSARSFFEREYRGPITAVIGEEVGGSFGHAVIYDVRDRRGVGEAAADSMQALGSLVHGRGGVVVLAHPGWWIGRNTWDPRRWMQYDALRRGGIGQEIDALELWNQVYWQRSRELIDEWVGLLERGLYVPIVGNSDFHRAYSHELGTPRNACLCPLAADGSLAIPPSACLLSAVREGRLYVTDGPVLDLQVSGRVPGEIVEALPFTLLAVAVRASAPEGGELHLYVGRDLRERVPLPVGADVARRFSVPVPTEDSFVRVEIVRTGSPEDRPPFSLLSNPVRIDVLPRRSDGWRGPDEGPVAAPTGFRRDEVSPRERALAQRRVRMRGRDEVPGRE